MVLRRLLSGIYVDGIRKRNYNEAKKGGKIG